jgi:hypothetical protein
MDGPLPDYELRQHVLAAAIRTAEDELRAHGYAESDRSAEVLYAALSEAYDETDGEETVH